MHAPSTEIAQLPHCRLFLTSYCQCCANKLAESLSRAELENDRISNDHIPRWFQDKMNAVGDTCIIATMKRFGLGKAIRCRRDLSNIGHRTLQGGGGEKIGFVVEVLAFRLGSDGRVDLLLASAARLPPRGVKFLYGLRPRARPGQGEQSARNAPGASASCRRDSSSRAMTKASVAPWQKNRLASLSSTWGFRHGVARVLPIGPR